MDSVCTPLSLCSCACSLSQADQQQLVQDFIVGCVSNVLIVGYEMLRKVTTHRARQNNTHAHESVILNHSVLVAIACLLQHSKELKHVPSPLLICDEGECAAGADEARVHRVNECFVSHSHLAVTFFCRSSSQVDDGESDDHGSARHSNEATNHADGHARAERVSAQTTSRPPMRGEKEQPFVLVSVSLLLLASPLCPFLVAASASSSPCATS